MDVATQKRNAKEFIKRWESSDRGREKQDSQSFWLDLLENVLGIEKPTEFIRFEKTVQLSHESFIDGYIDQTKVMIEQKGSNHDLNKPIKQSDGSLLTPFQQAQRYSANLPYSERPRWIVTCNFREFRVYDMEHPNSEPTVIELKDLVTNYYQLEFLVDKSNQHIEREKRVSLEAGELVGKIYSELYNQYKDPETEHSQKSINQLSVRLVFCLYAEDAGIFGRKNMFHDYLAQFDARGMRQALIRLFKVLDTKIEDRDPYLADDYPKLAEFPYVNGGMFSDENIEIPPFTDELKDLLLINASDDFDWSQISPTIFGAVFESTLNPDTRRQGGMHYTSVENIHKVIDPLFLNELKDELNEIKQLKQPATIKKRAQEYQNKLANLTFFDPACGSGNFLTETYLSLRKLENEAIKLIWGDNPRLDVGENIVKVTIQNFYGIEINDFAVSVAKTALWIAESQMLEATKEIVYSNWDFLPLKTYTHIHEGNALRMDWNKVIPNYACHYIMGNPPFVGTSYLTDEQKQDMDNIWQSKRGKMDYVSCWYLKAADYIDGTNINVAFVSTNSITQGEQAGTLGTRLLIDGKCFINYAYRTFIWENDSTGGAHVHVVIIGFSKREKKHKFIYNDTQVEEVNNINQYLNNGPTIIIQEHNKPIDKSVIPITRGSQATDNGYYLFSSEEKDEFIKKEPRASKYIKQFMMGREFLNNQKRYCLWMPNISPAELRKMPLVLDKVKKVKAYREASKNKQTQRAAEIPWRFGQYRETGKTYIALAKVSSGRRRYIPFGFLTNKVIPGDKLFTIPNATMYEFGILNSNVHMAWVKTVAGRLKSDYSYSTSLVYNNFPWPSPTDKQKQRIKKTAQAILDARALYPDSSLADLYDPLTMPKELLKAHQDNDRAVMAAYSMDVKTTTESDAVTKLFEMYEKLTKKK